MALGDTIFIDKIDGGSRSAGFIHRQQLGLDHFRLLYYHHSDRRALKEYQVLSIIQSYARVGGADKM
jgi:hypothetical protein